MLGHLPLNADALNSLEQIAVIEQFSGGWEPHELKLFHYRPRIRYQFKEDQPAAEVIEQVIARQPEATDIDLELALRLQLEQQDILYKTLYWVWLQQEIERIRALKRRNDAILLLLLSP